MDSTSVRSRSGTPVVGDFTSGTGTPIVVNTDNAAAFVLIAGVVTPLNNVSSLDSLTLKTPSTNDPAYDSSPIAGLHITNAPAPTTRNFVAGIWVQTRAATTDKGRGIMVTNTGASDSVYLQQDGVGSTGLAVLQTAAATGSTAIVVGTTHASQQGVVVRQEVSIVPTAGGILMTLEAEGSATEMFRIGSATIAGQVGVVFRLFGANAKPIVVKNSLAADTFVLNNTGETSSFGTGDSFIEGIVKHGATSIAANNAQVVTRGNVGPGAAGVAVLEWLKVKNAAGATRYIEMYG